MQKRLLEKRSPKIKSAGLQSGNRLAWLAETGTQALAVVSPRFRIWLFLNVRSQIKNNYLVS
jgi:hypothetical protein